MTAVIISCDTELSAGRHKAGLSAADNFRCSIAGETARGAFGIGWQMDRLEAHGLTGLFFVDPMPALVHGPDIVADIVGPIVARGHHVELHLHPEWLEWAKDSPVDGRQGHSIGDFSASDQRVLLALARDLLIAAGAPRVIAFRAGNFGANDDTLRALADLGFAWDSSFNPAYAPHPCAITLPTTQVAPVYHAGVVQAPISGLWDRPGHFRPAQVCAVSAAEMRAALDHAARHRQPLFTIVTHSFEMLTRDRARPNPMVIARYEAMLAHIAAHSSLETKDLAAINLAQQTDDVGAQSRIGWNLKRTGWRMAQQAWAQWRYERG
jgi:peptidoglycan/xylan/chitin deacetylase (PgdA/CDA1 family)